MPITETDKHYLFSLLYATGIILFWRGIWEATLEIPILDNVFVSLFLGLLIITVTGVVYKEFDPLGQKLNRITRLLNDVVSQSKQGKKFEIHYYDQLKKKHTMVTSDRVRHLEHSYMVIEENGKEFFVPLHRISRVHHKGKVIWQK